MTQKYRVSLPIDVGGRVYHYGDVVELDEKTAELYKHALIALPKGEMNADDSIK